jgi:hypothetical protein
MEAAPLGGLFHFNVSISVAGGLGGQCSIIATFPVPLPLRIALGRN